jgi:hypothetical protein
MDILNIKFLFSVVFVLIGSLAFHISALVSGENIYRDFPTIEATLLSTVAGIVIFLLSPISFITITFSSADHIHLLTRILDYKVLLAFFSGAFGLGLIFGCITILNARENILDWFRDKSGMRFWIYGYGITWDDFLSSVKRRGEVFVQTDKSMFKGLLSTHSIKDEQREIVLNNAKIKRCGTEKDVEGDEEDATLLIPGSEIKGIIVPERSFQKHYESMGHISQAFYCQMLAIGLFFLSYSAKLTGDFLLLQNGLKLELGEALASFYDPLSHFFLVSTIFVLCFSVWVAQKEFDNWWSFSMLSPPIAFMALFFSLISILLIICEMEILQVLIFIFILLATSFLYKKIIKWFEKFEKSDLYKKIIKWFKKPKKPKKAFDHRFEEIFGNLRSFLMLFLHIPFIFLFSLLLLILFFLVEQTSPVATFIDNMNGYSPQLSKLLDSIKQISPVLEFVVVFSLLYITISNWLKKPIKDCSVKIEKVFKDNPKLLEEVIRKFYLQLSCNEKDPAGTCSSIIKNKILAEYKDTHEWDKVKAMISELDNLKEDKKYLENEDLNIILRIKYYIKKIQG